MQSDLFQVLTRSEAIERGLGRYFTGEPCKNGHIAQRLVANYCCLRCRIERHRQYRQTAKFKKALQKYQRSEKFKAATRRYRQTAGYKAAEQRREQRRAEKRKIDKRVARQTEQGKAATRRYNKSAKHRIALRISNRTRRARKYAARGTFTAADEKKLRERQKKCHICGRRFTGTDPATLDHVIALADDGPHDASNIALAHASCNLLKRDLRTHLI